MIDNVVKDAVDSTTVSILSGPSNNDEVDLNQENGEDQPRPPVIDQPRIKTPTKIAQQKSETVSTESSSESLMPVIISASRPLYLPASNLKEMEFESESSKTSTDPQNAVKVKDSTEKISNDTDLISKVAGPDIKALLTAFPEALSVKPDPLFNNDREEVQARKGNDHKNQNEIETFKQKYVQAAVEVRVFARFFLINLFTIREVEKTFVKLDLFSRILCFASCFILPPLLSVHYFY